MATEPITVYGTTWCGDCKRAVRVLDQHNYPYTYIDIERDEAARAYVAEVNRGFHSVPTIIFPDGSVLVEPRSSTLAEKLQELTGKPQANA